MALLCTKDATMRFGGLTAVNKLNIRVEPHKIVAIIGPNGAGKTTAFNMITGVYTPSDGTVEFRGKALNKLRPDQITKLGISRTFQNIRLFKNLSVLDNMLVGGHLHVKSGLFATVLQLPNSRTEEKNMRERALYLLEQVGLSDHRDDIASSLPYGSQRRLEIARALMAQPQLLLLDEPAAGMNPKETKDLGAFIQKIRDDFQLTILLIEHHMKLVMEISDDIYVLEYGNTIAHGTPEQIKYDPVVIKAYLGEGDEDAAY